MSLFLIISISIAYVFISIVVGKFMWDFYSNIDNSRWHLSDRHAFGVTCGVFWPITMFCCVAILIANLLSKFGDRGKK